MYLTCLQPSLNEASHLNSNILSFSSLWFSNPLKYWIKTSLIKCCLSLIYFRYSIRTSYEYPYIPLQLFQAVEKTVYIVLYIIYKLFIHSLYLSPFWITLLVKTGASKHSDLHRVLFFALVPLFEEPFESLFLLLFPLFAELILNN